MEQNLRRWLPAGLVVTAAILLASIRLGWLPWELWWSAARLRDACILGAGATLVLLGLRHLRRQSRWFPALLSPLAGAALLGLVLYSSMAMVRLGESTLELLEELHLTDLAEKAKAVASDQSEPLERRIWASTLRAQQIYEETGRLTTVLDESGSEVQFEPTRADENGRRARLQLAALLPKLHESNRRFAHLVLGIAGLSALAGAFTPVSRLDPPAELKS